MFILYLWKVLEDKHCWYHYDCDYDCDKKIMYNAPPLDKSRPILETKYYSRMVFFENLQYFLGQIILIKNWRLYASCSHKTEKWIEPFALRRSEKQWYSKPLFVQNSFGKMWIGFSLSCTQFLNKIWLTGPLFPTPTVFEMGFYANISWESRCNIEINVWGHFYNILLVF